MSRVIFENQPDAPQFDLGRTDVACFVGLVRVLPGATLPANVQKWLKTLGYSDARIAQQVTDFINVPVLLESSATFSSLFDSGGLAASEGTDYVAAAVRSFFAQGGRRCYVVRVDDPLIATDDARVKSLKLQKLLPSNTYAPEDPESWTGVGCLAVLQDVSFLVTPDLPALCASQPLGEVGQIPSIPTGPEQFVECSQADITPQPNRNYPSPAPRLTPADFTGWASSVAVILNYLAEGSLRHEPHLREIQFVTAFPLPRELNAATALENPSTAELTQDVREVMHLHLPEIPLNDAPAGSSNISSAFLQLAYPWLITTGSGSLLESLEPADGALAGLLARNTLVRGAFTSATKITPAEIYDLWPALPAQELKTSAVPLVWDNQSAKGLIERLSLFGFTPGGIELLSDVTAYPGEAYRSAPVNRLVSVICRAARRMGEAIIFETSGPALWGRVQRSLQNLMTRLWTLNALGGASVRDAFSVRCDHSTMTQNDIDNGRLLADVTFTAASTLETIRVRLAMEAGGASAQQTSADLAEAV
jgi:Bacteriophage tail sheath protein